MTMWPFRKSKKTRVTVSLAPHEYLPEIRLWERGDDLDFHGRNREYYHGEFVRVTGDGWVYINSGVISPRIERVHVRHIPPGSNESHNTRVALQEIADSDDDYQEFCEAYRQAHREVVNQ